MKTYDEFQDYQRELVLDALDRAGLALTGKEAQGWTDDDLPALFRALDAMAAKRWAGHQRAALVTPAREEPAGYAAHIIGPTAAPTTDAYEVAP